MSKLDELKEKNKDLIIHSLHDSEFKKYGIVYSGYDLSELNKYMDKVSISDTNSYVVDNDKIEATKIIKDIERDIYAGMSVSAGECLGHCNSFSAIEFHQGSEVNITFTDVVMALGKRSDIENQEYNAEKHAELFFIPKGTVFEMYSDTLHYSPIEVEKSGFKAIVIVLQGTNQILPDHFKSSNRMVVKKNKFQLAHKTRTDKISQGILPGVLGKLIEVNSI